MPYMLFFRAPPQRDASRQNKRTSSSLFVPVFKRISRPKDYLKRTSISDALAAVHSHVNIAHINYNHRPFLQSFAFFSAWFVRGWCIRAVLSAKAEACWFTELRAGYEVFLKRQQKLTPHSTTVQSDIAYFVHGFCIK